MNTFSVNRECTNWKIIQSLLYLMGMGTFITLEYQLDESSRCIIYNTICRSHSHLWSKSCMYRIKLMMP